MHLSADFNAQRTHSFTTLTCRYREPELETETEQTEVELTHRKVASEPVTDLVAPTLWKSN